MKRIDRYDEYLASDADCSFAEWLADRPRKAVAVPGKLTAAMAVLVAVVLCCVVLTGLIVTKAGGLW